MKIIGLTGKTGSGKSTFSLELKKRGWFVIDADICAREITEKGSPALKELCDYFGNDILLPDGSLDRKMLAKKAFSSEENKKILNSITHPRITENMKNKIASAEKAGYEYCLIDAAVLLESDCKNLCHKIITVNAPEEVRLRRILLRDGITKEEAMLRISAQREDEYYFSNSDIIINNGDDDDFREEVEKIISFAGSI